MNALKAILLVVVFGSILLWIFYKLRKRRAAEITQEDDSVIIIDTPQPPPGLSPAETACFVVRSHPNCPADANVVATIVRGGPALQLTVDGVRETFIDRSYAAVAIEVENWLSTREETVPVQKANRHERRQAAALARKSKAN